MDWLAYLKEVGPFSAPLVLLMGLAMRWLLARLEAAETRERAAVEAKSQAQLAASTALANAASLIERSLDETDKKVDALGAKVATLVDRSSKP